MKIAIVGYGAMGTKIESIAENKGMEVVTIDPNNKNADNEEINEATMQDVDVAIDFTHPDVIMDNIKKYCDLQINAVIGTTGWYDKVNEVKELVEKADIGFLWSSNYSVGVNLYFKIIEYASKLMDNIEDYDIWGFEIHHHNKADSPSGTAKTLSKLMLNNIERKSEVVFEKLDRKIKDNEFHFASVRGGPVNFEHTIGFDSKADCIKLKHAARHRGGYALGAVMAADWLKGKKGYFEMEDFFNELTGGK